MSQTLTSVQQTMVAVALTPALTLWAAIHVAEHVHRDTSKREIIVSVSQLKHNTPFGISVGNRSRAWCQPAQTAVVHSEPFPLRRWPMCSQSPPMGLHRQPTVHLWSHPDHVAHRRQLPGIQV